MKRTRLAKRSKSLRSRLIKDCDDIFREIIRRRDKMTCQRTGEKTNNLDVAHFHTRTINATRWDEDNACLLKKGMHRFWAHVKHEEFRDFWIKRIGKDNFDRLKMKASYIHTTPTSQIKIIKIALQIRSKELCKN